MRLAVILLLLVGCAGGHGRRPQERTMLICEGNTNQTMRCTRVNRDEFETEMRRRGQR